MLKCIKRIFKSQSGMGLPETLVAVAILGTAIVVFAAALSTGVISTGEHGQEVIAQRLAQNQIESIKNQVFNVSGTYTAVAAPAGYAITINKDPVPGANTDIQKITVTVLRDGAGVFSVSAYKANR